MIQPAFLTYIARQQRDGDSRFPSRDERMLAIGHGIEQLPRNDFGRIQEVALQVLLAAIVSHRVAFPLDPVGAVHKPVEDAISNVVNLY